MADYLKEGSGGIERNYFKKACAVVRVLENRRISGKMRELIISTVKYFQTIKYENDDKYKKVKEVEVIMQ